MLASVRSAQTMCNLLTASQCPARPSHMWRVHDTVLSMFQQCWLALAKFKPRACNCRYSPYDIVLSFILSVALMFRKTCVRAENLMSAPAIRHLQTAPARCSDALHTAYEPSAMCCVSCHQWSLIEGTVVACTWRVQRIHIESHTTWHTHHGTSTCNDLTHHTTYQR